MVFCFSKSAVSVEEPVTTKYEVQESPPTNALTDKFAQYVEDQSAKFEHDSRFKKGMVRYKDLKQHMINMENKFGSKLDDRRTHAVEDECSICLEALGNSCDVTTTACNHKFHTFCLVESLGSGICTSCPLCRTDAGSLVPTGMDGSSLKLIAKLRINVDTAQWCHRSVYDEVQSKAVACKREAAAFHGWRPFSSSKKDKLRDRVSALIDQVDLLEQYGRINSRGFSKLCKKIDKKFSTELAQLVQSKYVDAMGFHRDCVPDGNGKTRALREELQRVACGLSSKPLRTAVAPSEAQETMAIQQVVTA